MQPNAVGEDEAPETAVKASRYSQRPAYRVERPKPMEIADDSAHLWAVSYADVLMVLLCFFILFFSFEQNSSPPTPPPVAATPPEPPVETPVAAEPQTVPPSEPSRAEAPAPIMDSSALIGLDVEVEAGQSSVLITFPQNEYRVGESKMPTRYRRQMLDVLRRLEPQRRGLRFEFIGHSDPTPVHRSRNPYLQDNFDLSAQRAAHALRFALANSDLSPSQVSALGAGDASMGQRALTLRIRPLRQEGTESRLDDDRRSGK